MDDTDWATIRDDLLNELPVETASAYIDAYSDSKVADLGDADQRALAEMDTAPLGGLRGFSRRYPMDDQSVIVALTNPQLKTEGIADSDNYRLATETDMRAREHECLQSSYLRQESNGNATSLRNRLAEAIIEGPLPNPYASTSTSTIADELRTDGEEYAYLTNFYKFATTGFDDSSSPNLSGHIDWFDAELSALSPDYLVGLGAPLWKNYLRSRVEPHATSGDLDKSTIEDSTISDDAILGNQFTLPAYDVTVIPGQHPQAMETGELV